MAENQKVEREQKSVPFDKIASGSVVLTVWQNPTTKANGEEGSFQALSLESSYLDKEGNRAYSNSFTWRHVADIMAVLTQYMLKHRVRQL